MTRASYRARKRLLALFIAGVALLGVVIAPSAHAVESRASLTLNVSSISTAQTVSITFDVGNAANDRNWVGIYRGGTTPGGPASLDWRYVTDTTGELTWGPTNREGWTRHASSITAGDYDIYLLENDGYDLLAGPIRLTVTDAQAEPPPPPADPKPSIDGVSELNVLALNAWHGGTQIPNGMQEIAKIIIETDADVTFLPERGLATAQIAALLGYQQLGATNTGIVSRYPIVSTDTVGSRWSKAVIDVNGTEVAVYGGHLEYRWYTAYLPRGYGGAVHGDWPSGWNTWNKLDGPVTDVNAILRANLQSGRPAAAAELVTDIAEERAAGRLAIVGGDFNEPSSQDWTAATADLFDHNGVVIPWHTTQTLIEGGLVDAFRTVHPNPVTNPGFTWPSDNERFPTSELTWAPDADERDRIDYIFATPDEHLTINDSSVVGPQSTIVRNQRVVDDSEDEILTPDAVWPSDHKAVLAQFSICEDSCAVEKPEPALTLGASSVVAGGKLTIDGNGFTPESPLTIELRSTPVAIGTITTDAAGTFHTTVTIPQATTAGAHHIVVIDPAGVETAAPISVTASPSTEEESPGTGDGGGTVSPGDDAGTKTEGNLANTGVDILPFALTAAMLLAAGLLTYVLHLRRYRRS